MNQVEQQVECQTCQWNKACIDPPSMTKEEVEAKMAESKPSQDADKESGEKSIMGSLMSAMFFGSKDRECHVCPVFAERLRSGPELSNQIKEIMKGR